MSRQEDQDNAQKRTYRIGSRRRGREASELSRRRDRTRHVVNGHQQRRGRARGSARRAALQPDHAECFPLIGGRGVRCAGGAGLIQHLERDRDRRTAHSARPTRTLRLNSSVTAARQILSPIVLEYLRRYPEMKVELVTEARLVDIVLDGFDVGIRLAESVPRDMVAVPLGSALSFSVVGSPAYFADRPIPLTPADLMAHRCIRARWPSGEIYRWEFARQGETLSLDVPGVLTLDEPTLMLQKAATEGAGPRLSFRCGGRNRCCRRPSGARCCKTGCRRAPAQSILSRPPPRARRPARIHRNDPTN